MAAYDTALAQPGASREAIVLARSQVALAAGDAKPLLAALAESEVRSPDNPITRNYACWERATRKLDLAAARVSCEAAVKLRRDAMFVDSLAMVELQSGNYPAAIAAYNEAVQGLPSSAPSIFGRGIAKLRAGDKPGGEADLARARQLDPDIDAEFSAYGLKP
jgi:Flp pilus assembly protein TadD